MLLSERIVIWTIWALTVVGGFFSARRLLRRKNGRGCLNGAVPAWLEKGEKEGTRAPSFLKEDQEDGGRPSVNR